MLTLTKVTKIYRKGAATIRAVNELTWQVPPGAFAVVHGPSGSGKSTLLMILGGMLTPTAGRVVFGGHDLYAQSHAWRNRFRRQHVGFIFQRFHLLPYFTVFHNIALPLEMKGAAQTVASVHRIAARLGLEDRLEHYPAELSVGQQQRVAMARALAGVPELILADEPTGNLDRQNAGLILRELEAAAAAGKTVIAVTHDARLLERATHKLQLDAGTAGPVTNPSVAVQF
jgi:ABC-type lipoprotein export system ATPase subunit